MGFRNGNFVFGHQISQHIPIQSTLALDHQDGFFFQNILFLPAGLKVAFQCFDLLSGLIQVLCLHLLQQFLFGTLPDLCKFHTDNAFDDSVQLGDSIAGLSITLARMPDFVMAAVPGADFPDLRAVCPGPGSSTGGQSQPIAAMRTENLSA